MIDLPLLNDGALDCSDGLSGKLISISVEIGRSFGDEALLEVFERLQDKI